MQQRVDLFALCVTGEDGGTLVIPLLPRDRQTIHLQRLVLKAPYGIWNDAPIRCNRFRPWKSKQLVRRPWTTQTPPVLTFGPARGLWL